MWINPNSPLAPLDLLNVLQHVHIFPYDDLPVYSFAQFNNAFNI